MKKNYKEENMSEIESKLIMQEKRIERLETILSRVDQVIEEKVEREVALSQTFHGKAMQRRIDQFIFDIKIAMKNGEILDLAILDNAKKKLFDE